MPDETNHPRPVIVISGHPSWAAEAVRLLDEAGFDLHHTPDLPALFDDLLARYVALVLVDAARSDWREWVVRIKTEQATRRIPSLVIGPFNRRQVAAVGAEDALHPAQIAARLVERVRAQARVIDPERQAELGCQCDAPLPDLAREGIARFNAGEYYRQHDLFEELWVAERGPVRDLYRAILQIGVAYYHITQGNPRGALKMLHRSAQWLAPLPDVCQGVDVAALRADAARVRHALEAHDPANGPFVFDRALLRPVLLLDSPGTT